MGKFSRDKGRRAELEVLARLNAIGGDGELLYGQPELGGNDGDVDTNYGRFEVKRRAAFPAWMTLTESVRGVYCRRDRGEWCVLIRAIDLETLLLGNRQHKDLREHPVTFGPCGVHGCNRAGIYLTESGNRCGDHAQGSTARRTPPGKERG